MIDVKDFGAKGDGINNDAIAIQHAIDSAVLYNTGNIVEINIPVGVYLINSSITLKSNIAIKGEGTLKVNADGIKVLTTAATSPPLLQNVKIEGITIDGGGQTGSIYTGKKGVTGIYLTNAINIIIDKVTIKNCGTINSANPFTDNGFSGLGILAECRLGKINNIKITNCTIQNIAGGGVALGDGIAISGYNVSTLVTPEDIFISNCSIFKVGRNGISVAGASPESLSKNVRIQNNYISNTSISGIDVEDGTDIILEGNQFYKCGNIQLSNGGYYDYGSQYPSTYRLRAAIATGISSNNILIANSIIDSCNMGITFGALLNKITNVSITNSDTSDITQGLAGGGNLVITDSSFNSNKDSLNYYSTVATDVKITNCNFSGSVKIKELHSGSFINCSFNNGVALTNPNTEKITWNTCIFTSGSGTGIGIDATGSANRLIKNCIVTNCRFYNLASGIVADDSNILTWQVINCIFSGITTYGIRHTNANSVMAFKTISGNHFINTGTAASTAISINQSNPKIAINNNYFELIASCISITNILTAFEDVKVGDNLSVNCTNGITITLGSGGSWNRCIITYNNIFGCSGTKLSLPGTGNAAGFVSNNII